MLNLARSSPTFRQKLILTICGIVSCIVLLEIGLRLGGFIFSSWQEYLNRIAIHKAGAYRIMCLGESTTAGGEDSYPSQLEKILNQRNIGIRFSVINKGVVGINTAGIISQLEDNLDKYKPDMVTAMIGNNDRYIKYYEDIPDSDTVLFERFRAYRLARILWMNIAKKIGRTKINNQKEYGASTGFPADFPGPELTEGEEAPKVTTGSISTDKEKDYLELGFRYKEKGKYTEAEKSYKKAVELNPGDDKAYLALGYCYKEEGEFVKAEDAFKKVIELNPAEDSAYLELGWLYTGQRKYVVAKEMFERALELNTSKKHVVYLSLGFYYEHQKKYAEAAESFKKTIELEPVNYGAHLELGWCYGYQGKYAEAEEAFKKAIELNPKDDGVYGALAVLYKETGRSGPADEYYKKAESERMKNYYSPTTIYNCREIKRILDKRRIKLVCIQYPMVTVQPLKKIFEEQSGVMFVDNERVFKKALDKGSIKEYFADMFAGDFGHCTQKGNRLLAENIANTVLKEVFGK